MSVWKPLPLPLTVPPLSLSLQNKMTSPQTNLDLCTLGTVVYLPPVGAPVLWGSGSVLKHGDSAINQKGVTVVLLSSSMRLLMMCAERAELDKAESLLLLLGSYPLKSHCGPGLVFKTSYSLQLHGSAYGMCACLDLHVHVFFCCGCCSFEQCDPFLPPHLKKKKKKDSPPVCFMWKQGKSHNPHVCDTAWLKWEQKGNKEKHRDTQTTEYLAWLRLLPGRDGW